MKQMNLIPVHLSFSLVAQSFSVASLLLILLQPAIASDQFMFLRSDCAKKGNYKPRSTYHNNLQLVLTNLTSKAGTNRFYNFSSGETPNKVYGLFLCNGFFVDQVCLDCISQAAIEIQYRCPASVEATVWYSNCMLRYANRSIFSITDVSVYYNIQTGAAKYSQFNQRLSETFISLFIKANAGNSSLRSAIVFTYLTRDITGGCYVDCTPDLSTSECNKCLQTGLGRLQLEGSPSGILLQPSCRLMYILCDVRPPSKGKGQYITFSVILAVAVASLLFNVLVCYKARQITGNPTGLDEIGSMEHLHFEFQAIKKATSNFAAANKLGKGGFGVVYKGTLADGKAVAIKRLSNGSRQGIKEFKTEACLAAKLQHKNLVKLFGFCLKSEEKLLVYEFLPNKSLDRFLFDSRRGALLKWKTRYKIIKGIAQGLLYLHENSRPKIIHRDLKPSNVLLDGEMNPKIADFGMAKLFGVDQTQGNTSRVAGTFGYMAPEYIATGHFSTKSDIFSYGVIVLETLTGQKNSSYSDPEVPDENLLNYAWRLWNEGAQLNLVDSALEGNFSEAEVQRCIHVSLLCIQQDQGKRPDISTVLLMLNT